ncbi:MAG: transketolase, partial [Muribaculum sp.]|nr:transketolase [Muribaculum sp.]
PWIVPAEVADLYTRRTQELRAIVAERHAKEQEWAKANPDLAAELQNFIDGKLPEIDWADIKHKPDVATRNASSDCLTVLSHKVKNMIVSSADLCNSDKTDGFLKGTHAMTRGDLSGGFLHAGVAELTMASIMNGIALHGGLYAACGTFFVFSDYMKPAIRMAALMELPVKYVWSHDAFRVGEDGPTHEPIEQEAQIRLLEQMNNLSGKPSILVLRPADAMETNVCWKMAMENKDTPTALILSRQNVPDIPAVSGERYTQALGAEKGAYIIYGTTANPDITLVANGSEVSLLIEVAKRLEAEGISPRVVSAPSIGLFEHQDTEYRASVIPTDGKIFGLTAGLPVTLRPLVGAKGEIYGLERFGASAPYKVLDEKFGYTADNIFNRVKSYMAK